MRYYQVKLDKFEFFWWDGQSSQKFRIYRVGEGKTSNTAEGVIIYCWTYCIYQIPQAPLGSISSRFESPQQNGCKSSLPSLPPFPPNK